MKDSKRGIGRVALYLTVIGAMAVSLLPAGARSVSAQGDCRNFSETGFDVCGRFLEVWSSLGDDTVNTYINGLPLTEMRPEISLTDGNTYDTQWFERARFEMHPENEAPYDVLFGLLGVTKAEGRGSVDPATGEVRNPSDAAFVGIDQPDDVDGTTKVYFPETRHTVSGTFLTYWNTYGGLPQFGFPLSEPFEEVSEDDGNTYTVQYFERNRFEAHPENAGTLYEVQLGRLGDEQDGTTPIAASELPIAPPEGVTSSKDTAVVAFSQEPANLTFVENLYVISMARDLTEDGLIGSDDNANLYPEMAWYVPTLENGGSYYVGVDDDRHLVTKYKIRRGLMWNDGVEFNSNDVIFSFEYSLRPDTNVPSRVTLQKIANADNPDPYTAIFNWMSINQARDFIASIPDPENYTHISDFVDNNKAVVDPGYMLVGNASTGLIPRHILNDVPGTAEAVTQIPYAREGHVGTGPYMVETWVSGSEITFTRNPNYTLTAPPILDRIVIRFIPQTDTILAGLQTGEIDLGTSDAFAGPSEALNNLPANIIVEAKPAAVWEHLDFQLDPGEPLFQDRTVRHAIISAIDRQQIVDVAYLGQTDVLHGVAPPLNWYSLQNPEFRETYGIEEELPIYPYDPELAKSLLDQAGWTDADGDGPGFRTNAAGETFSFELATTAGNANRELSTQIVQQNLAAVGVEAVLAYYPGSEYFGEGGIIDRNVCKICLFAWVGDPIFSDFNLWLSSQIPSPANPSGQNNIGYSNPEFDALANAFAGEIDRTITAPIAAQAQIILMEDIVTIPLYARANIEVHTDRLQNLKTTPSSTPPFWNITQWYFN